MESAQLPTETRPAGGGKGAEDKSVQDTVAQSHQASEADLAGDEGGCLVRSPARGALGGRSREERRRRRPDGMLPLCTGTSLTCG